MVARSKAIILFVLIALSSLLFFGNFQYPNVYLEKIFFTFSALAIIYFIFEIVFEEYASKKVKDSKTKYFLRKIISILNIAVSIIIFVAIWIVETQNILIAFGLIGAAVAFALQDIFKNFIGGIMIFLNGISIGLEIGLSLMKNLEMLLTLVFSILRLWRHGSGWQETR